MTNTVKAALIIIGSEILSGRTLDKNTQHIAQKLNNQGINLIEVRIIPDDMETVVRTINTLKEQVSYVFTTGGLGPTHDDITVDCIAAAFGVEVEVNPEAYAILLAHYGDQETFTPARQRMARIPQTASLIENPASAAPGFQIGNVYAMAGVPKIMQAMLDNILPTLEGGAKTHSRTIHTPRAESDVADILRTYQEQYPAVEIGSYPYFKAGSVGVSVVLRSTDTDMLDTLEKQLTQALLPLA